MNLQRLTDEKIYEVLHFLIVQGNREGAFKRLEELEELIHICYVCKGRGEVRGNICYPTMPPQYNWVECPKCKGTGKLK